MILMLIELDWKSKKSQRNGSQEVGEDTKEIFLARFARNMDVVFLKASILLV